MARLKLTVFAVLVLGLGLAHLFLTAPKLAAPAVAAAKRVSAQAAPAVDAVMAARHGQVADLALAVSQNADISALVAQSKSQPVAPTPADFQTLTQKIAALSPATLGGDLIVGWSNGAGGLFAKGSAAPAPKLEGVDPAMAAPGDSVVALEGVPYRVVALAVSGKGPTTLVVGAPLFTPAEIEAVAQRLGLPALAVLSAGKPVAAGGPKKAELDKALPSLAKAGEALTQGKVASLGPVQLPIATHGDVMGGKADTSLLTRAGLSQQGLEVASVVDVGAQLAPLAASQALSLELLGAGAILFIVFLVAMGGGAKKAKEEEDGEAMMFGQPVQAPQPVPGAPARAATVTPSTQPAPAAPAPRKDKSALDLSELPHAPEANPEDFDFGAALSQLPDPGPAAEAAPAPEAAPDLFADLPASDSAAPLSEASFDSESTTMYPTSLSGTTQLPAMAEELAENEEHEATRVAAIPSELLQESIRRAEDVSIPSAPPEPLPQVAPSFVDSDEVHFQEVFSEFVTVRDQCGEGTDGNLTYEKFAAKLRKNREQLSQKYDCRTVRFQVYVKEGKAALKATPVKD